jgi:hypothetical protein
MRRIGVLLLAAACLFLLPASAPAATQVRVSVEFAYGGIVAGGVGLVVYFSQSFTVEMGTLPLASSLARWERGGWHLGIPLVRPEETGERTGPRWRLDLLRLEF